MNLCWPFINNINRMAKRYTPDQLLLTSVPSNSSFPNLIKATLHNGLPVGRLLYQLGLTSAMTWQSDLPAIEELPTIHIHLCEVDRLFRQKGIGRALVSRLVQDLGQQYEDCVLIGGATTDAARSFWSHMGFGVKGQAIFANLRDLRRS